MENIGFNINNTGEGTFFIIDETEQLGEMEVSVSGKNLTVYHTEVIPKAEGRGLAKKMLDTMVAYAREHNLKVIPLCPYVHAQFKRHPNDYADIWLKNENQ